MKKVTLFYALFFCTMLLHGQERHAYLTVEHIIFHEGKQLEGDICEARISVKLNADKKGVLGWTGPMGSLMFADEDNCYNCLVKLTPDTYMYKDPKKYHNQWIHFRDDLPSPSKAGISKPLKELAEVVSNYKMTSSENMYLGTYPINTEVEILFDTWEDDGGAPWEYDGPFYNHDDDHEDAKDKFNIDSATSSLIRTVTSEQGSFELKYKITFK